MRGEKGSFEGGGRRTEEDVYMKSKPWIFYWSFELELELDLETETRRMGRLERSRMGGF